jgi:Zn-dependent protease with chaperone function
MNIKEADEEEISIELYKQLLKEHGPDIMASTNKHTWHIARILERILVSNDLGSLHHHTPTLSEPARRRWRLVFVCDPSVVNAMSALGTIVVFTGILPLGRDEDGLAAILAHGARPSPFSFRID